jgi:hypothetical protein
LSGRIRQESSTTAVPVGDLADPLGAANRPQPPEGPPVPGSNAVTGRRSRRSAQPADGDVVHLERVDIEAGAHAAGLDGLVGLEGERRLELLVRRAAAADRRLA